MTVIILGPNNSGKSVYAEKLAAQMTNGPLVYIATMIPYGEDGLARVEKHKKQRAVYGFITIEAPFVIPDIKLDARSTVLLEDISNLLGNAIFMKKRKAFSVIDDIIELEKKCENLIMVTIDGLFESDGGDAQTAEYIKSLNEINRELSKRAEKVIRMEDGMPYAVD